MKKKKEIELFYTYDCDYTEDFANWKREELEEKIKPIKSDINDCKKWSNLFNKLTDECTVLINLTKLSDKDLKDKYENEYDEYYNEIDNHYWNDMKEEMEDKIQWYYLVSWNIWLWNWNATVNELRYFSWFSDFLKNLSDWDYIKYTYYNNWELEFKYSHHDWKNSYYLTPIENLSKSQLINLVESDKEDAQDVSKCMFGRWYKSLIKVELETLAIELMD